MKQRPHVHVTLIVAFCTLVVHAAAVLAQGEDVASKRPPGDGPTRVEIAFFVIDIMRIIDTDETFEADVFILARWKDSRLVRKHMSVVSADEVWTPNIMVFNKRNISRDLPDVVEIQPDGTVFYRQRLTGTFASRLDLSRFPKDSQTLELRLVLYGTRNDEVVLTELPELASKRSAELSIVDWKVGTPETETGMFEPFPGVHLSTMSIRFDAHRLVTYYIVQILVPLFIIVSMSWIPFWIDPAVVTTRASVGVTTVLTLIAYRFMVGGLVPKLPYLTRMDYFLLATTILVACSLATVAAGAYLVRIERKESVTRMDRIARATYPLAFIVAFVGVSVLT